MYIYICNCIDIFKEFNSFAIFSNIDFDKQLSSMFSFLGEHWLLLFCMSDPFWLPFLRFYHEEMTSYGLSFISLNS